MKKTIVIIALLGFAYMASAQKVSHLTKESFKEKIWNYEESSGFVYLGDKPAIIDFYADWCAPCRRIAPIMEDLQKEYQGELLIYKIDTQVQKELAAIFQIQSIPALLFIPLEDEPRMALGARSKSEFKQIIEEVLSVKEPGK